MTEDRREYHREYMRRYRAGRAGKGVAAKHLATTAAWKDIPGYPGYCALETGEIWSAPRNMTRKNGRSYTSNGQFLKQNPDSKGYLQVRMWVDGKHKSKSVHRAVWEAFNGPTDLDIHHKDHDILNNRLDNLEALTRVEHQQRYIADLEEKAFERGYAAGHETGYDEGYAAGQYSSEG